MDSSDQFAIRRRVEVVVVVVVVVVTAAKRMRGGCVAEAGGGSIEGWDRVPLGTAVSGKKTIRVLMYEAGREWVGADAAILRGMAFESDVDEKFDERSGGSCDMGMAFN
jgi:hypothetical protein